MADERGEINATNIDKVLGIRQEETPAEQKVTGENHIKHQFFTPGSYDDNPNGVKNRPLGEIVDRKNNRFFFIK